MCYSPEELQVGEFMAIRKTKKRVRKAWSKDDVRDMKVMAKEKKGVERIARLLKRTVPAVRYKASVLGISLAKKSR
jgi:hypothetical protein